MAVLRSCMKSNALTPTPIRVSASDFLLRLSACCGDAGSVIPVNENSQPPELLETHRCFSVHSVNTVSVSPH